MTGLLLLLILGANWLDFLPNIMKEDSLSIKEEYKMDGTHIHPKYVQHLEKCLQNYHSNKSRKNVVDKKSKSNR